MRTKSDGIAAARGAIQNYQEQADDLRRELDAVRADRADNERQLRETTENLATGLLPTHEISDVENAKRQTGASHLRQHLKELDKQRAESQARVAEIGADERYVRRELLIHPTTGDYSQKIREESENLEAFRAREAEFSFSEFLWLYRRGYHQEKQAGVFTSLWRVVTLASHREEKALGIVRQKLGSKEFRDLAFDYDETREGVRRHEHELAAWQEKKQEVLDLISEREELLTWIENFPDESVRALRIQLAGHLEGCDFEVLHGMVDAPHRVMTGKCHALTKKTEYLDNLKRFLRAEISDREDRIASIGRVQRKWSRKPYGMLRGDKTKWLVDVPNVKRESTRKRVGWSRTIHHNVYVYDNYDHYSVFLSHGHFLPYDAFAYGGEERMPYEGFSRTVIPELDEYRDEFGMEKADYTPFEEQIEEHHEEFAEGEGEKSWNDIQTELDAAEEGSDVFDDVAEAAAAEALVDEMVDDADGDFEDAS